MNDIPILSNLEKRIILVLGEDLMFHKEISRYTITDINRILNEYNQKYDNQIRLSPPNSTVKSLIKKELVDSVFDTVQRKRRKYYLLTELGIKWFHRAKKIEDSIFQS